MLLSKKRIIKVLIRLRGCVGWSAPVLFANPEDRFSRIGPIFVGLNPCPAQPGYILLENSVDSDQLASLEAS